MVYMKHTYFYLIALFVLSACTNEFDLSNLESNTATSEKWIQLNCGKHVLKQGTDFLFEGDIILTQEQIDLLNQPQTKSGFLTDIRKRWPNGTVVYTVAADFKKKNELLRAMEEYKNYTNIDFREKIGSEANYVEFVNGGNISDSHIGMIGGKQRIRIADNGTSSTVMHEIGHTIGLLHEHSRYDRDEYITINWNNIIEDKKHNFNKYSTSISGVSNITTPFDYSSIMIYSSFNNFCLNTSEPCLTKKDGSYIYATYELSKEDITSINNLYKSNYSIRADEYLLTPCQTICILDGKVPAHASIIWSIGSTNSAKIISGQGTKRLELSVTGSLPFTLKASIYNPRTGQQYDCSKNISPSSVPQVWDIEINKYDGRPGIHTLKAVCSDPKASASWNYTGGGYALFQDISYPGDASFLESPLLFKEFEVHNAGTYNITAIVSNENGSSSFTKSFYITDIVSSYSPYFVISPNPVKNADRIEITVPLEERMVTNRTILIYKGSEVVYSSKNVQNPITVDIKSLENGTYNVTLIENNKKYENLLYINRDK